MQISEEAVEAAANAISEASGMRFAWPGSRVEDLELEDREYALAEARAALQAAAPHILAEFMARTTPAKCCGNYSPTPCHGCD